MSVSHDERTSLADLLLSTGPDAPTLCEGWTTRDLAVHLVVRESRPDAAAGMFIGALSGHLDSVSDRVGERPYAELVEAYRSGPPVWNPMRWADRFINLAENFVHHEDVRRGGGEWVPRDLPQSVRDELWLAARTAGRGFLSSSGPSVHLVRTDGDGGEKDRLTVGNAASTVTVTGEAPEIVLWLYGRDKACNLTFEGPVDTVVRRSI
ncbi:TIGR03085 family metal-binding protein [Corynebacterium terpenotabidum]|uniref:MDMPI C-terminal domain-containing protein n=1 Tax=Corynebacterium terpenotabidum Y-11 TaxID=1200352 RepID=S4XCX5_9CORY|nr:TIGR03085 family metal-binding protein [Corynebacterium terpenotabidum]AGP30952.1 hypothetical protein A606_06525 [Corynebacterium terpenotabidum Y-11]